MKRVVSTREKESKRRKQFSNVKVGSDCYSSGIFSFSVVVKKKEEEDSRTTDRPTDRPMATKKRKKEDDNEEVTEEENSFSSLSFFFYTLPLFSRAFTCTRLFLVRVAGVLLPQPTYVRIKIEKRRKDITSSPPLLCS